MRFIKIIGLLSVAAAAMMAFAAGASATGTITSPPGTPYKGKLHATASGHTSLHSSHTNECQASTIEGNVTTSSTPHGPITALWFGGAGGATTQCTNGHILHVKKLGTLKASTTGATAGNAKLYVSGVEVEITTKSIFGPITCILATGNELPVGEVTGSKNTGGKAIFDISATIPRTGGSGLCGENVVWTGSYTVQTPTIVDFSP